MLGPVVIEQPTWGQVEPEVLASLVVVSPHFDDAILGTSHLLMRHPSSTVITVFGGRPARYPEQPGPWDSAGGFVSGDDVVAARQEEDRRAMEVVEARPVWLDFVEHQYLEPADRPAAEDIVPALASAVTAAGATAVFLPMGLANPDHGTAHDAGLLARELLSGLAWFCYEDAGYSQLPGLLAWRVSKLFRSGLWPTPALVPQVTDAERKRRAIWCYASQIPPLEAEHALSPRLEANSGEQYWRLAPPPSGWEALADVP
ncbi:MAG: PIG-L deacetylase family protein [Acidimicrobiales bacterium]